MQDKSRKDNRIENTFALINSEYIIHRLAFRPARPQLEAQPLMVIEGFTMRKGVKEREGVNETPRRGGCCVFFFSAQLDSFFIVVVVDLGLILKIFFFDIFDIFWICFACNHIFLRFLDILDIFQIFFSFNLSFSYLQDINKKNIKS